MKIKVAFIECDHNLIMILIINSLSLEVQYAFIEDIPIDMIIIILMKSLLSIEMIEISYIVAGKIATAIEN